MDVQPDSSKHSSNASSNTLPVKNYSSMESSFLEEQMPKARKPYTITKQRERWTEEEHNKFLEALQLHGRAWRRIEEHIGTKTTVQIRSHAQKFFTKVSRESSSNCSGTVKGIEIPPPRPKRKPSHPYPRKMGTSSVKQLEKPFLPKPSIFENENGSPTSVLSDIGFEATSPLLSNHRNNCNSPIAMSAAAGSNGQGSGGLSPAATGYENDTKSSSVPNQSAMEVDLNSGVQARTLKLFGRTVLLSDSAKNSPPASENLLQRRDSPPSIQVCSDNTGCMDMYLQSPQDGSIADFLAGPIKGSWNQCFGGASTLLYLPSDKESVNSTDAAFVPMPWLAFYGSLPFPFVTAQKQSPPRHCFDALSNDEGMHKEEGSWTGSVDNSGDGNQGDVYSVKAEDTGDVEQEYASRLEISADKVLSNVKNESREGFVPYKRYTVDREMQDSELVTESRRGLVPYTRCAVDRVQHQHIVSEDADGQRMESCL